MAGGPCAGAAARPSCHICAASAPERHLLREVDELRPRRKPRCAHALAQPLCDIRPFPCLRQLRRRAVDGRLLLDGRRLDLPYAGAPLRIRRCAVQDGGEARNHAPHACGQSRRRLAVLGAVHLSLAHHRLALGAPPRRTAGRRLEHPVPVPSRSGQPIPPRGVRACAGVSVRRRNRSVRDRRFPLSCQDAGEAAAPLLPGSEKRGGVRTRDRLPRGGGGRKHRTHRSRTPCAAGVGDPRRKPRAHPQGLVRVRTG